jgi:hypothetical protein
LYKIGVTNNSIESRYSPNDLNLIEVLWTKNFLNGIDAYRTEQEIISSFQTDLYTGEDVLESVGISEVFIRDVLGKDLSITFSR